VNLEMHIGALIKRVWRCNWRHRLRQLRETLGGCHPETVQLHLEAEIE
jgi:hypothetical protein